MDGDNLSTDDDACDDFGCMGCTQKDIEAHGLLALLLGLRRQYHLDTMTR